MAKIEETLADHGKSLGSDRSSETRIGAGTGRSIGVHDFESQGILFGREQLRSVGNDGIAAG